MPNARSGLPLALALTALACEASPAPAPSLRVMLSSHAVHAEDAGTGNDARSWHAGASGTFPARLSYHTGQQTITTLNLSGPIDTATPADTLDEKAFGDPAPSSLLESGMLPEAWKRRVVITVMP